jgi:hypothetical protein
MRIITAGNLISRCLESIHVKASGDTVQSCQEKHYAINEVAEMWNVSRDTVRRLFYNEPGVVRIGKPLTMRKRVCITIRIPASVLQRVHDRLAATQ